MEDWKKYEDIINLEHPEPKLHPRISASDRAAQFAPFSALTGYGGMISETSRLTDPRVELDDERMAALNEAISVIAARTAGHPEVIIERFLKDSRKEGGAYVTLTGAIQNVEIPNRRLILKDGTQISFDDLFSITILD